ncbi:VOC family protein [Niabella beijingensis]|uniref:VOC family protein n=1 Tax=Niabella beijingensis TaxID=2872700 RepID=UPI001CBD5803|nr:VOC family protein [Niabella beijingensis]MBZ4192599.1 VOC family protein [Niabella beijingensis]
MKQIHNTITGLELAQIGWVVPDIHAAIAFLSGTLGIAGFPEPEQICAQDLNMTYYGRVVAGEWLTTQTYNGGSFIELVQPLSGQSMFQDYLNRHPEGGTQHLAFRAKVNRFEQITGTLRDQGYAVISEVDHPIARMAFFDTYRTLGVVTEIMGITPEGWTAIQQMQQAGRTPGY